METNQDDLKRAAAFSLIILGVMASILIFTSIVMVAALFFTDFIPPTISVHEYIMNTLRNAGLYFLAGPIGFTTSLIYYAFKKYKASLSISLIGLFLAMIFIVCVDLHVL
jgi:Na+-driven multidrug efflux pump